MTGRARAGALVAIIAFLLAAGAPVAGPVDAQATGAGAPVDCSERVEVLLLIDESASLDATDPAD